jgi:hypothetical protein
MGGGAFVYGRVTEKPYKGEFGHGAVDSVDDGSSYAVRPKEIDEKIAGKHAST